MSSTFRAQHRTTYRMTALAAAAAFVLAGCSGTSHDASSSSAGTGEAASSSSSSPSSPSSDETPTAPALWKKAMDRLDGYTSMEIESDPMESELGADSTVTVKGPVDGLPERRTTTHDDEVFDAIATADAFYFRGNAPYWERHLAEYQDEYGITETDPAKMAGRWFFRRVEKGEKTGSVTAFMVKTLKRTDTGLGKYIAAEEAEVSQDNLNGVSVWQVRSEDGDLLAWFNKETGDLLRWRSPMSTSAAPGGITDQINRIVSHDRDDDVAAPKNAIDIASLGTPQA